MKRVYAIIVAGKTKIYIFLCGWEWVHVRECVLACAALLIRHGTRLRIVIFGVSHFSTFVVIFS